VLRVVRGQFRQQRRGQDAAESIPVSDDGDDGTAVVHSRLFGPVLQPVRRQTVRRHQLAVLFQTDRAARPRKVCRVRVHARQPVESARFLHAYG